MNRFSVLTGIPESTKGLVRELRVRWALEEMGLAYEEVRYPHAEIKKEPYLKKQPFGQVPYFESDDICLFETGAILLYLAEKYQKLLPKDAIERAHVYTWMFTALTSIEPYFIHSATLRFDPEASEASRNKAKQMILDKLKVLSKSLGTKEYFGGSFSIAEITMTSVLSPAQNHKLLDGFENVKDYVRRNESRPAFQRALSEHVKLY